MKKLWILFVVAACMPSSYLGVRIFDLGTTAQPVKMANALMLQVCFIGCWLCCWILHECLTTRWDFSDGWLQEGCICVGCALGSAGAYYVDCVLVPGQHITSSGWQLFFWIQVFLYFGSVAWRLNTLK